MNNKNNILVGCLALLLVLSVGYALFGETVTINGTATAKGDFDITTTCEKGISSTMGVTNEEIRLLAENGYDNDSCSVVGNDVSFNANLKYPGAARYFTIKATNTGSIPATLDMDDSDSNLFESAVFKNTTFSACSMNDDGSTGSCSSDLTWIQDRLVGFSDANGFYSVDSDELMNFIDENTGALVLETGESIWFVMGYYWPEDYTSDTNSANYAFDLTTEMQFKQITE